MNKLFKIEEIPAAVLLLSDHERIIDQSRELAGLSRGGGSRGEEKRKSGGGQSTSHSQRRRYRRGKEMG